MTKTGYECHNCNQARMILTEWIRRQGQERCWYYPDVFRRLMILYGMPPIVDRGLPPRAEFEAACERYQAEEYGGT